MAPPRLSPEYSWGWFSSPFTPPSPFLLRLKRNNDGPVSFVLFCRRCPPEWGSHRFLPPINAIKNTVLLSPLFSPHYSQIDDVDSSLPLRPVTPFPGWGKENGSPSLLFRPPALKALPLPLPFLPRWERCSDGLVPPPRRSTSAGKLVLLHVRLASSQKRYGGMVLFFPLVRENKDSHFPLSKHPFQIVVYPI